MKVAASHNLEDIRASSGRETFAHNAHIPRKYTSPIKTQSSVLSRRSPPSTGIQTETLEMAKTGNDLLIANYRKPCRNELMDGKLSREKMIDV